MTKMTKSHEHYSKTLGELTASKCKAKAAFTKIKHELIRQLKQANPNVREVQSIISRLNECQSHALTLMVRLASEYKDSDYKQCWRNTVRETEIMKKEFEEARKMAHNYLEKNGIASGSCTMTSYGERSERNRGGSLKEKCIELVRDDCVTLEEKVDCVLPSDQEQLIYERDSDKWDFTFQETGEGERWMHGSHGWMDSETDTGGGDAFAYTDTVVSENKSYEVRRRGSDSSLLNKEERGRRSKDREVPFAPSALEKEKAKQEKLKQEMSLSEERVRRLSGDRARQLSEERIRRLSEERTRRTGEDRAKRASSEERLRRTSSIERSLNLEREEQRLKNLQRKSDPSYVTQTLEKIMKSKRSDHHQDERYSSSQHISSSSVTNENSLKGIRKEHSKSPSSRGNKSALRRHVSFGGFDASEKTRSSKTKHKHSTSSKSDTISDSLISVVESRRSFINYNKLRVKLLDIMDYPKPRRKTVKDVQDMMKTYYKKLCDDILILSEEYKHDIRRKEVEMMDAYNMAQMYLDSNPDLLDQESESGMSLGDFSLKDLPSKMSNSNNISSNGNNSQRTQLPSDDEFLINVNVRL